MRQGLSKALPVCNALLLAALALGLSGCQTESQGAMVDLSGVVRAYRQSADPQPARAQAERLVEQLPAEQLTDLGVMYEREGRLEDAVQAYQRAISRDPWYPRAHLNLGNALRKQGKRPEALERYRKAMMLDPRSFEAANNFADLCAAQGTCLEEAVARLAPLVGEAGARRAYGLDTLGWLYYLQGDDALARRTLESALEQAEPGDDGLRLAVHEHLAQVCAAQGDEAQARRHGAEAARIRSR
ncbi:MAG: tetratricopeptide repeat protein [Armatimonadota bacterium]